MAKVRVCVTLKPALLDSAGRTVGDSLARLGFDGVRSVRIGKIIELEMDEVDPTQVKAMCERLLANPVIEDYVIEESD
ncbi:MAG: phosphoribosylformylglycinamidine synthase subunit PurS [Fimbriimonadaceae bacterium]|nr:phosphoribosylformylglycinamidine synthase subunit PurS [Fimbriimonadaceae bacterium]